MTPAPSRTDKRIALAIFVAAFAVLFATEAPVGFVRDESIYFAAGESYAGWLRLFVSNPGYALSDAAIVRAYDVNHEHPALMKTLFGLSHQVFAQQLGIMRPAAAFRLPAFAMGALVPALLFLFGTAVFGRRAGLFAALSFFVVPRQFFHAHLACFDLPIAAIWLWVVYAFWRAQTDRHWWIYAGIAFGLAIATKHNGFFLPVVLAPFALYRAYRATEQRPEARRTAWLFAALYIVIGALLGFVFLLQGDSFEKKLDVLSPATALYALLLAGSGWLLWRLRQQSIETYQSLGTIASMAFFGPAIFYLHWPYLWHHPVERTSWYLAFHAQHNNYTWYYLGTLLRDPPFPLEYVVWVTALTVPVSILAPMTFGLFSLLTRAVATLLRRTSSWLRAVTWTEVLIATHALTSIAIISHPNVPHFGGVKHWFPSMPFLALLAGNSVSRACEAGWRFLKSKREKLPEWAVSGPVFTLLLAPAFLATARVHPYGTSAYAELAGGPPGAASLGMQRQYWSNNVTGVLPWLNEHVPSGARVYFHEVTGYALHYYQENGMLRSDIRWAGSPADADFVAYQYHQEFREQEFEIWQAFGTQTPVYGLYVDQTPQIVVYRRP